MGSRHAEAVWWETGSGTGRSERLKCRTSSEWLKVRQLRGFLRGFVRKQDGRQGQDGASLKCGTSYEWLKVRQLRCEGQTESESL